MRSIFEKENICFESYSVGQSTQQNKGEYCETLRDHLNDGYLVSTNELYKELAKRIVHGIKLIYCN